MVLIEQQTYYMLFLIRFKYTNLLLSDMAWLDFIRLSRFKLIANGIILALLLGKFFIIALTYCPVRGAVCPAAFWVLVLFLFSKIIPIIIATWLLTSLGEFLYRMFR